MQPAPVRTLTELIEHQFIKAAGPAPQLTVQEADALLKAKPPKGGEWRSSREYASQIRVIYGQSDANMKHELKRKLHRMNLAEAVELFRNGGMDSLEPQVLWLGLQLVRELTATDNRSQAEYQRVWREILRLNFPLDKTTIVHRFLPELIKIAISVTPKGFGLWDFHGNPGIHFEEAQIPEEREHSGETELPNPDSPLTQKFKDFLEQVSHFRRLAWQVANTPTTFITGDPWWHDATKT